MQNIINSNQKEIYYWKISLISICICSSIYGLLITKNHFLDDAFTHLRIARNLMENGFYSFNGITRDFSTSSPLYTTILSKGLIFWDSPYLAKLIGIVFYFFIYILTSLFFLKTVNTKSFISSIFLIGISSPMGVRWLTDGMETPIIMLFSMLLAYYFESLKIFIDNKNKNIDYFITYFLCTLSILLRIEFIFIIIWYLMINIISNILFKDKFEYKKLFFRSSPLIFAFITSFTFIFLNFGNLTPDTSIAKAGIQYNLNYFTFSILRAHFGASLFGISLAISLLLSIYFIFKNKKNTKNIRQKALINHTILINFSLPLMLLLILIKGQMIQGIRYLIFIETFLITFNLLSFKNYDMKAFPLQIKIYKYFSFLLIPLIISPWLWNDFKVLKKISKGRSETFINLNNRDFSCFKNKNLIAEDLGMISYFSQANIFDPAGLINGRDLAKITKDERLNQYTKNTKIDYAFLNDEQIEELKKYLDLKKWETMDSYKFPNFKKNSDDVHYLLKSPEIQPCSKLK